MIDIRPFRDAPEDGRNALARRGADLVPLLDTVLTLDTDRRAALQSVERLKAERNAASEQVAGKRKTGEDPGEMLGRLKELSATIKRDDAALSDLDARLREALLRIPNLPLPDVPDGDASANTVVRQWGEPPSFADTPRPHWEIGEALGVLDLPGGAKVAGSGFPVYRRAGARLIRGLINFMLDIHTAEHGYQEVWPPALVNTDSALGTGQLPDLENNMYVTADGLYLVPTAEVPVTNLHRGDTLAADALPLGYVAYSPCFRREAGAHGKGTRGINRVHQFDKVELVRLCTPSESRQELERILGHAEAVLQRLELPYRVLALATGDMGFASAKTYDLEVWAAGADGWLEVSSASVFTDFQARRANIRYRPEPGAKPEFVHTLNASGLALPRTIIALLENNQQPDGSVRLPEALVPYVGTESLVADGA